MPRNDDVEVLEDAAHIPGILRPGAAGTGTEAQDALEIAGGVGEEFLRPGRTVEHEGV